MVWLRGRAMRTSTPTIQSRRQAARIVARSRAPILGAKMPGTRFTELLALQATDRRQVHRAAVRCINRRADIRRGPLQMLLRRLRHPRQAQAPRSARTGNVGGALPASEGRAGAAMPLPNYISVNRHQWPAYCGPAYLGDAFAASARAAMAPTDLNLRCLTSGLPERSRDAAA